MIRALPALYDLALGPLEALGLARLRRALVAGVAGDVLELGVGTGRQLAHYPAAARVVGIDSSTAALARATARGSEATLVAGSAERLPFPDDSFDWVVCALVLCSVDDPPRVLGEVRRVLRPRGRLRALEHVRSPYPGLARIQRALNPVWGRIEGGCRLDRATPATIAAAGFRLTSDRRLLAGHVRLLEALPGGPAAPGPGEHEGRPATA